MTRLLSRPFAWSLFALGAALAHAACGGGGGSMPPGRTPPTSASSGADGNTAPTGSTASGSSSSSPENDWNAAFDPASCHASNLAQCDQHAADVIDALETLIDVEQTNDKRSVPIALDAIRSRDAELVIEGLRIVGPFPKEPGVYAGVLPRLIDPRPVVRQLAARILSTTSEGAALGRQYEKGHGSFTLEGVLPDTHDPPRPPSTWGFVALANATPYAPGDGQMSLGFSTAASVDEVAAFYAKQPNAKRLSAQDYMAIRQKAVDDASNGGEAQQIRQLQEQMLKANRAPDAATQQKMRDLFQKLQDTMGLIADTTPYPPDEILKDAQFVVLTMPSTLPERWVAVYKEPAYDRTVAILSWSPSIRPAPMPVPPVLNVPQRD